MHTNIILFKRASLLWQFDLESGRIADGNGTQCLSAVPNISSGNSDRVIMEACNRTSEHQRWVFDEVGVYKVK